MRRPVLYLAGLLVATGASLALAGPASAAPSHHRHNCHHDSDWGWNHYRSHSDRYLNGNTYNGINILNGVLNGGGLF